MIKKYIKNYVPLLTFLLLQSIIVKSAILPENFDFNNELRGWGLLEDIKKGLWITPIALEFNNLQTQLKELESKHGLCSLKLPEYNDEKHEINTIELQLKLLDTAKKNAEYNVSAYKKQIGNFAYELKNDSDGQNHEEINKQKSTIELKLEENKTTFEKVHKEIKTLQEKQKRLEKIINQKTAYLKLNKKNLESFALKQILFDAIQEIETDNNREKNLSVYIHAILASFFPIDKATDTFLSGINPYQSYVLYLSNFFNWYTEKDNEKYAQGFERYMILSSNLGMYYKTSYIALVKNGLKYYKKYRLQKIENSTKDQAKKEICDLLESFKNNENFKEIYQENLPTQKKVEEINPGDDDTKDPKINENKTPTGLNQGIAGENKWTTYQKIGIFAVLASTMVLLYNYKKILQWFK